MEIVLALAIVAVLAWIVTAPLRHRDDAADRRTPVEDPRVAELEARKQAKYREIRDAEMDREAGKLTEEEWRRQNVELRREAIKILKRIDELEAAGRER